MSQDLWIESESLIRKQLELQVELSFHRHHQFMLRHGLAQCQHVLDIGTGNGLFLERVAQRHPLLKFRGVDDKAHMIDEAKSRNEANLDWMQADALDERVQTAISTTDDILMRYFVLHMPDTRSTIPRILSSARPGTQLWIMDLDAGYSLCEPEHAAFSSFQGIVRSFCDKNSVEIRSASMLPSILKNAGFEMNETAVEPFTNQEIDSKVFAEYLLREATLYHYFLEETSISESLDQLQHFLYNVMKPDTHFVRYGMAMISAVKSNS